VSRSCRSALSLPHAEPELCAERPKPSTANNLKHSRLTHTPRYTLAVHVGRSLHMTAHAEGTDIEDLSSSALDDPASRLQRKLPPQVQNTPRQPGLGFRH
jgi:hypothetical protein